MTADPTAAALADPGAAQAPAVVQAPVEADPDLVPSRLRLAVMRLARRLRQEAGSDITWSQQSALASVERLGPVSLKDLADVEHVAPPSMTRISTCLEERGLVVRTVDAADRRVAHLAITDDGRLLLYRSRLRRDAYLARRLANFSPDERATITAALPLLERLQGEHLE